MLRVRVVSPAGLTGPLVERLTAAHGVQNLVVLREAVRRPQGDAVHFDLSDGAANPVSRELRELGLAQRGLPATRPPSSCRGSGRSPTSSTRRTCSPSSSPSWPGSSG
jgi:hypothetical protein